MKDSRTSVDGSDDDDDDDDKSICLFDEELQEDDEINDDVEINFATFHKSADFHFENPCHKEQVFRGSKDGTKKKDSKNGKKHRSKDDKFWGHSSSPMLSLKDIRGGEKNATEVGMTRSGHGSPRRNGDSKVDAKTKRKKIMKRMKAKQGRKDDIQHSLTQFLQVGETSEVSDFGEDDSLISNEEKHTKPMSASAILMIDDEDDDRSEADDKSIKSSKSTRSHSKRRRRQLRRNKSDGPGRPSHQSSRPPRRRPKPKVAESTDDDDDASRKSRRGKHRSGRDNRTDGSNRSRRRREHGDNKSGSDSSAPRRRRDRSRPRGKSYDTDDRSVGSRKSVGRRRKHRNEPGKSNRKISPKPPPSSAGKRRPASDKPSQEKPILRAPSLSGHIESNPGIKEKKDGEDFSEESSRFSFSHEYQQTLLQFDPTNANNFKLVNQREGNVTSEMIRHADGTESELQIHELSGLPTFENPEIHNSARSGSSDQLGLDAYDSSSSYELSGDDACKPKSMSSLIDDAPVSTRSIEDDEIKPPKSFKEKLFNSLADEVPPLSLRNFRASENKTKTPKVKKRGVTGSVSLFDRMRKRKDESDSDEEIRQEMSKSMFGLMMRSRDLTHHALGDDYESE